MTASLPAVFNVQEITSTGAPAASYRLYTYAPGTTTQKVAYTDEAATIPHTYVSDGIGGLYIALNSRGELPASLYLTSGGYDICLKTDAGATVWTRRAKAADDAALSLAADLASTAIGKGTDMVEFKASGSGAVDRTATDKLSERISVSDFLTDAELAAVQAGASAVDVSAAVRRAVAAAAGRDLWFDAPGTYYMATPDAGAYITLATAGTRLRLERMAKLRFADAAVYGINITGALCAVEGGLLWGTNTTAPTITALVHVDGSNCNVADCNIAYGAVGVHVDGTYIAKIKNNSYSNCDRYLYVTGSCADIRSSDNTYGTTHIGTNAAVEIAGPGVSLDDEWETQDQTKLSLLIASGAQRTEVNGKMLNSGGVTISGTTHVRYDVIMHSSYTGTAGITVGAGSGVDLTGSYLSGPGASSGVTCIVGNGVVTMGAGRITQWQLAVDINSVVAIGNVVVDQCTTAWDVATAASGTIVDCTYSGVTTKLVRTASATVSLPGIFTASAVYDPANLVDGAGVTTTVTVTGTLLGDDADVTFSNDLQGIMLTAWCTADTVNVRFQNETGGAIDLASGTLRVKVSTKAI